MVDWILSALSDEQQAPLAQPNNHTCILAAAGSGKTRTLVHLLAADLMKGVAPTEIIAFTFTEKAADELRARIYMLAANHMPELRIEDMYVGTIHRWCLQYLLTQKDFYNVVPVDELHMDSLISRLYDMLELKDTYGLNYPRGIENFVDDLEIYYNEHLASAEIPAKIRLSVQKYLNTLRENGLLSFGGMIRYAIEHLQQNNPIETLKKLYVDEYQDVNPAQVLLVKAMIPPGCHVVAVGDDLQCIYNWRGSDIKRILQFPAEFIGAVVFKLSTNYRARPEIVTLANQIAENISVRFADKVMRPGREPSSCNPVLWLSSASPDEEVVTVTETVEKFIKAGVPANKIAILLRSVTKYGKPFVDALTSKDVPVQCPILTRGGKLINELILPLIDWLCSEHREPRNEEEETEAEERARSLWEAGRQWMPSEIKEGAFWTSVNHWKDLIDNKRNEAYNIRGCMYEFLDKCGIRIVSSDHDLMVGLGIASQIIRSVEEMHRRRLRGEQRRPPRGVLKEVYFTLLRKQSEFGESIPIDLEAKGVLVTTIHQAKGLEWPIVIVPMLVKGAFPVRARKHGTSYPDMIAARYGTTVDDERRLFYVVATRAKERLVLSDSQLNNGANRSVFIKELHEANVIKPIAFTDIDPSVWKLAQEDLILSDPSPIRIGLSDLLIYLECPYQYGLRRLVSIQPSIGEELGYGKGLHELIRRRCETDIKWTPNILEQQINTHVNLPYMSANEEGQARKAIESRLKKLDDIGVFDQDVESELPVEVMLNGGIVSGIIDSVIRNPDKSLLIRDWKSNIHDEYIPRYERQLQFYVHALDLQSRKVTSADIVDIAATADKNELVVHHVDIGETTIKGLIKMCDAALQGIRDGIFEPNAKRDSCRCCDMYKICGERLKL